MEKTFWVYIMASRRRGTMYTGLTSELVQRVYDHKAKTHGGFTAKYDINLLVWFESHAEFQPAYEREKKIKRWLRSWKYALIEAENPEWEDLYPRLL